ncbi:MAG TPA: ArsA family ATPase [Microthrixaceae bacterium]|nr:ArsA family ATPase [Microthrixaceae bacterium]
MGVAPPNLLDRRLLFVTGKGGVGKTTIAAALATLAAEQGRRTLVCEVDAKGNLGEFVGSSNLKFQPREVHPGLFAMHMETEESLKEYLRLQLRVPLLSRLGPLARTFDFVATAAPGVKEILTIGKLAYEVRERNYDLVIVDASATGHVVGELASPVAMSELVRVGVVRQQTDWMIEILQDPATTGVVIVTTPEEMPVNETLDLMGRLDAETDIDIAAVIANRVLPELFNRGEEETFEQLDQPEARATLAEVVGEGGPDVIDAARLAVSLRRASATHLTTLRSKLPANLSLVYVPYQFTRTHGMRTTRIVAEHLAQEVL